MRVLGIDPGTAIVGYSIIDFKDNRYNVIDYGCIFTDKDEIMEDRICIIFKELSKIIEKYKPSVMAIEELFYFKNNKTVISVAQARGAIVVCGRLNNLEVFNYTPLQVKMGITGYGRAEKKQIQLMVTKILGLAKIPTPDDAADALAVAITHINTSKSGVYTRELASNVSTKNLGKAKLTAKEYRELLLKR